MSRLTLTLFLSFAAVIQAKGFDCRYYGKESGKSFSPFREEKDPVAGAEAMLAILFPRDVDGSLSKDTLGVFNQMRDLLGRYLPTDFDWEEHLGFLQQR